MRLKPYEIEAMALDSKDPIKETSENPLLEEMLAEEEEIRNMEGKPDSGSDQEKGDKVVVEEKVEEEQEEDEDEAMPVPQVRLGPDGEIVIDDQSLVSILHKYYFKRLN